MFDPIMSGNTARTRRPLAVALSFAGQVAVVGLSVLVPVLHPEGIVPGRLLRVVAAPPIISEPKPPVENTPSAGTAGKPGPRIFAERVFREPRGVPQRIFIADSEPPALASAGFAGPSIPGFSSGVPWGVGINATQVSPPAAPRPTPPPARPIQVKVGGVVQAAKILHQVMPVYPPLARLARISGTVRLEAVIARSGIIQSLKVISGHHLLVQAALEAVGQWTYQPTLLNGDPVEVLTQIEVNFKLAE